MITTNLSGRVKRNPLKPRHALLPLYEAVSNSLHALEPTGRPDGRIVVELDREPAQVDLPDAERREPITVMRIRDNGVGFTEQNAAAFAELDTFHKLDIGGKGIGRLSFLKVFQRVRVESVYEAAEGYRRVTFDFQLPDGVLDPIDAPVDAAITGTVITLSQPLPEFRDALAQRTGTVAGALVRHFLVYLLKPTPPVIELVDGPIVMPVRADTVAARASEEFPLGSDTFTVHHIKIRAPERRQHAAHYCANSRPVTHERLSELPDRAFHDDDVGAYYYQAYVFSSYLDRRANELRTGFDIEEERQLFEQIGFADIRQVVKESTSRYLASELTALAGSRDARVDRVLSERLPDLQYVRDQNSDEIAAIPLDATDSQVEQLIGEIHLRNQRTGRELLSSLVHDLRDATSIDLQSFEQRLAERIQSITRPSQANLAGYMLYRRSIVDLYAEILKKSESGFQREAAIHKLLFPMRTDVMTSSSYINHNLWLLDERLTYANYIASDQRLVDHKTLFEVDSLERPDIACYFSLGFSEDEPARGELRTVVIVELKKPGPVDSRPETPWQQVMRYIARMREGFWAEGGQRIKATDNTRFYCFIVCDTDSPKIKAMIDEYTFHPVFDGADGYTLYNPRLRAYVELMPFEKVLRDADRKHRVFFERLGLPS